MARNIGQDLANKKACKTDDVALFVCYSTGLIRTYNDIDVHTNLKACIGINRALGCSGSRSLWIKALYLIRVLHLCIFGEILMRMGHAFFFCSKFLLSNILTSY